MQAVRPRVQSNSLCTLITTRLSELLLLRWHITLWCSISSGSFTRATACKAPPPHGFQWPKLALRPDHGDERGEHAKRVEDGEADGAEHEDTELCEEEDEGAQQEGRGTQRGDGSWQHRDTHLKGRKEFEFQFEFVFISVKAVYEIDTIETSLNINENSAQRIEYSK